MRAILTLALLLTAQVMVRSQVGDPEAWLEFVRTDLKTQRVAIITEAMQLNSLEAGVFWPVYREYQAELSTLGDEKVRLTKDYLASYETMTDRKADQLAKSSLALEKKRLKLKEKYYNKMKKAISPSTAARFFQVENQLQAVIDMELAMEMPVMPRSVLEQVEKHAQ